MGCCWKFFSSVKEISQENLMQQFFGWILGFGSKAKLVYPDDVMTEFSGYLDRIREMY